MRVQPLAQLLQTKGLGTVGQTIFVDSMPPALELAIMLNAGIMADPVSPELPGYHPSGKFQAIVRCRNPDDGFTLIRQVIAALATEQRITLTDSVASMMFNFIRQQGEPMNYPASAANLVEISVNFDCNYVML
jgi:hypothetical protein